MQYYFYHYFIIMIFYFKHFILIIFIMIIIKNLKLILFNLKFIFIIITISIKVMIITIILFIIINLKLQQIFNFSLFHHHLFNYFIYLLKLKIYHFMAKFMYYCLEFFRVIFMLEITQLFQIYISLKYILHFCYAYVYHH